MIMSRLYSVKLNSELSELYAVKVVRIVLMGKAAAMPPTYKTLI